MRGVSNCPSSAFAAMLLSLFCAFSVHAVDRRLLQQGATDLQQPDGTLLKSMHCFNRKAAVWLDSTDWKASSEFLVRTYDLPFDMAPQLYTSQWQLGRCQ